jgi:Carbohydrate esterase, sialic acid-specific acetylesterase
MKPQSSLNSLALALGSAFLLSASAFAESRTWTSANGANTFEAELLSYSSATGSVKVKRADGRELTFKQTVLSPADIEFLTTQGDIAEKKEEPARSASSSIQAKPVPDTLPRPDGKAADMTKPVQVFIMMGQSNMVGMGEVGPESKNNSLEYYCKSEKKYPYLIDDAGKWIPRNDVRCAMVTCDNQVGWLEPGFGAGDRIGPELGFGHVVGHAIDAPVLLIKACIGNRSLGWDLLPPGTEPYDGEPGYRGTKEDPKGNGEIPAAGWYAGKQYDDDTANAKAALADLESQYPGAKKYEVAGFVMWQAEKDHGNQNHMKNYEKNLVQFIKSLRKDFNAPNAKFVCATLGEAKKGSGDLAMEAQFAVDGKAGKYPEFKGNVATVYANPLSNGGSGNGHYGNNAGTYMNVGEALGKAMVELLAGK